MAIKSVAVIPARSGSERVRGKNIKLLAGKPLMAHSILAAIESGCFESVFVVTDDESYAEIAVQYGAMVPGLRPVETATSISPDITWVEWFIAQKCYGDADLLAIVRPTSPFRSASTIQKAMCFFEDNYSSYDSLRSISRASVHPGKMWVKKQSGIIYPILPYSVGDIPWHSCQTKNLSEIWYQNASLEIVKINAIKKFNSISGERILGFETPIGEEVDINTEIDFEFAEFLSKRSI